MNKTLNVIIALEGNDFTELMKHLEDNTDTQVVDIIPPMRSRTGWNEVTFEGTIQELLKVALILNGHDDAANDGNVESMLNEILR